MLEAVMVSVNYADYLVWSLCRNRTIFDRLIVVTADWDWDTQNICREYNVECIKTNIFKDGAFPKSAAINIGLSKLSRTDWVCHLDSDIILPTRTREMLEIAKLNPANIYSILRMNCPSYESWIKWFYKPHFVHENEIFVHYDSFPVGAVVSKTYTADLDFYFEPGFVAIGFFQIWNEANGKHLVYPETTKDAGTDDMLFCLKNFPNRENRQIIPEVVAIHLQTPDGAEKGVNWNSRKTKRFGPDA
jgi:hypothetical protein